MREREKEAVRENLRDAGCPSEAIEKFMRLGKEDKTAEQAALLAEHRTELLRGLHENQRKIDRLDFLAFKMTKAAKAR
ncbi:MAG: hypothetical protein LUG14_06915 [Synergistaceae bacterium]|nr:hypothetical protein [Synergistaceae bacterium]